MLDARRPGPDYALRWPRELFVQEAQVLLSPAALNGPQWLEHAELLVEEAFASDQPVVDLRAGDFRPHLQPVSPKKIEAWQQTIARVAELQQSRSAQFLRELVRVAPQLHELQPPRPYFPGRIRRQPDTTRAPADLAGAKRAWAQTVRELLDHGYLERVAPRACVDDHEDRPPADAALDRVLADRLGGAYLWTRVPDSWSDPSFFGMVEVIHDLVARPRHRDYHGFSGCGWHYAQFAEVPAQILYRWSTNRLLARHGIDLQLAKSGDDVGRLVHGTADGREDLIAATVSRSGSDGDEVRHAITLFRARGAGVEHKRSACTTLARVLESRRQLLKAELFKKDEGALFQIANEFDLRHRGADQHADYDQAYLDWIFWWYLATVELTDRLIGRQPA